MNRLFLLDAYALIYRAYYAFLKNPRVNSKGFNTSAIFGFVNSLEDVLKRENPSHIAVAFDPAGKTFRHEAYEQYKAQRLQTPEDIRLSIPIIKQIIEAYGIPIFQVAGYEADDVIGTLAKKAANEGFDVFMMTPDKDYAQLVDTHIFQYKPRFGGAGFDTLGIEEIKAKYDLESPLQVIDLLGLMGDASDNIPGCMGVGEKTAAKLLKEFHSIENLLENTAQLKGTLKEKIEQSREQIIFSKFLATIKIDVPVDFSIENISRKDIDNEKITEIFTELEFRTFLAKNQQNGAKTEKKPSNSPQQGSLFGDENETATAGTGFQPAGAGLQPVSETQTHQLHSDIYRNGASEGTKNIQNTDHQYFIVQTEVEINDLVKNLSAQKSFCFDTETTSLNTFEAQVVGLSFAFKPHSAFYVPIAENQEVAQKIISKFAAVLADENICKIGQNMKYDMLVLANYGIKIGGKMFDTMIAHYLLNPELRHNMDYLAEILLNYKTVHFDDLFAAKSKNNDIRTVDLKILADYAAEDADITLQLKNILEEKLKETDLEKLFYD
ncbi:MAG: DNA polymerase I, partial [Prevotellaceae bacterium]|nr:DNA polymerase I [Prevotellaceae bacterium]